MIIVVLSLFGLCSETFGSGGGHVTASAFRGVFPIMAVRSLPATRLPAGPPAASSGPWLAPALG